MEIDPSPPKKLWKILKIVFFMMRKGISKSKLMLDFHMLMKRSKLAGKALTDHMLHHHYYSALSCRSTDASLSFVSPREYEFSCSNSPAAFYPRRKRHQNNYHNYPYRYGGDEDISVIHKVFDILNAAEAAATVPEASPLFLPGFGFGKSPAVRQLRITDSPFPVKDEDGGDGKVDKQADEFIKKFYKELKHQKKMADLQSPSPYHIWATYG
ncbi:TRNA methyltransferase 10 B like [Actinidia chinensis var. chinensis]|uniref:tRNA methyltransferase 10 B like n=1 Tax=Actinidia chinensis var. chinensis TaxID=1590841 RepID=A0A2R6QUZ2_ACTCC|nr:TRNA methyltransferase 10 B like [Actinidia chinensis var. chinensis]